MTQKTRPIRRLQAISRDDMVSKKKASNPVVQQRKAEKARQLARNKQERQMQREAMLHIDDPAYLRQQLKELLDEEEAGGVLNAAQRSKKKTLQAAYEASLKKKIHSEAVKKRQEGVAVGSRESGGSGEAAVLDVSAIPLPSMPPPGAGPSMPPPLRPPPGPPQKQAYVPKQGGGTGGVVSGASTVVARPKAQHDVALTSFVPSSVVRRPALASKGAIRPKVSKVSKAPEAPETEVDDVPDNLDDFLASIS